LYKNIKITKNINLEKIKMGRKPKNQTANLENQDQPIIEEENLVKKTCRELGITQKELALFFEVTPHTVTNWVRGRMEKVHQVALKGLIYEHMYKDMINTIARESKFTQYSLTM